MELAGLEEEMHSDGREASLIVREIAARALASKHVD